MNWNDWAQLVLIIGGLLYLNNRIDRLEARYEARLKELEAELSRRLGKVMNSHLENIHKLNLWQAWRMEGEDGRHDAEPDGRP